MERLVRGLRRGGECVAIVCFATMFALFLVQIFARYILDRPLDWTQEACVILYIWGVFWTAAFLLKERDHVAFTVLYDIATPARRRLMAIVGTLAIGVAFLVDAPGALDYVRFMKIQSTPVLGLRFDWVFSIFIVFMAAVLVRAVLTLARLAGRRWREATGDAGPTGPEGIHGAVLPAEREFE